VNQTKYIGMDVHQATTFYDSLNVHAESSTYGHSCNRVFGTPVKWGESPHENYQEEQHSKKESAFPIADFALVQTADLLPRDVQCNPSVPGAAFLGRIARYRMILAIAFCVHAERVNAESDEMGHHGVSAILR
jgi:hypothetical protein